MLWVKDSIQSVIETLTTNELAGLDASEAEKRLEKYGLNEFAEEPPKPLLHRILHHLREVPTLILIFAALIAGYAAIFHAPDQPGRGWPKVIIILAIVVINVVLGLWQEGKAERALQALKKMNAYKCTVLRGGVSMVIDAAGLVPGDIVQITAGDVICADCRLLSAAALQVDESHLTGESQPIDKDPLAAISEEVPLGDRLNMVYSGSLVTNGRASCVVVETAMETEMGKIANMLNNTVKMKTPLQMRLEQLAKRISALALLAGVVMFAFGFILHDNSALEMLILAVALGVAAVPETLPIIVTMVLSYGVYNMAQKNSIIRKMPSIETLGQTSVICSDKTGTLTMNKMQIRRLWHVDFSPILVEDGLRLEEKHLVELMASCSNAKIEIAGEDEHVVGDPTEIAIIRLLHDLGLTRVDAERLYPRVHELPFDSTRKRMTTLHHVEGGYLVVTKGAFDSIPVNWEPHIHSKASRIHDTFATEALRVIAISYKMFTTRPKDLSADSLECDQIFLGLVGMIDPPRPESAQAVSLARTAGIKTVMITGDHLETARAIAHEIGIMEENSIAISGVALAKMPQEELIEKIGDISVYARVTPEDKIRIVQAFESCGAVVAMTGDGVNDAPALKAADVGVAMGITGTEVTKSAADMVITDDNFSTIVDAISMGRTSFDNIRKTIVFLLSVNFAEIFILLTGMLVFGVSPLLALQILLINVVSDGIPGFFMAFEPAEDGVMNRPPLPKDSGVFSSGVGIRIAFGAAGMFVLTMGAFILGHFAHIHPDIAPSADIGITMAFVTLSIASVLNIFNVRASRSVFRTSPLHNRGMFIAAMSTIAFTFLVALAPPLAGVFGLVTGLSSLHWLIMAGLASAQLLVGEVIKLARW